MASQHFFLFRFYEAAARNGETSGFMNALVDANTQRILDAAVLGLSRDEVPRGLKDSVAADMPDTVISRTAHNHPTGSELVPTVLQHLKPG